MTQYITIMSLQLHIISCLVYRLCIVVIVYIPVYIIINIAIYVITYIIIPPSS